MADGLEKLNKELIHRILQERGLTLYQLEKCGAGGVSRNVWRRVRKGEEVRPSSRVAIASFLQVEPSSFLLLERKAVLKGMVGGKPVVTAQVLGDGKDPPLPGSTEFRGRARLRELYALDDDGQVRELTKRYYYGELANATLTIHGTRADLIIDNETMYDDVGCSKECALPHCLQGHGLVLGDSVTIRYTVKNQKGRRLWAGVCVLSRPILGPSHGFWMTAGHKKRGSTVLGVLELELKSSEEVGDHNQREG